MLQRRDGRHSREREEEEGNLNAGKDERRKEKRPIRTLLGAKKRSRRGMKGGGGIKKLSIHVYFLQRKLHSVC